MSDWVPCYRSLMRGRKRALPRATRFVFLELCSEAREGGGVIELAPGLSLGEAVRDIIGGNRKETHAAVAALVSEKMIDVDSRPGFLGITTWDRWKLRDLTNAERQARFRTRKNTDESADSNGDRNGSRNGSNANSNGESNARVTAPTVTPPLPDQIRSEEKREEKKEREGLAPKSERATRLPEDWVPSSDLVAKIRNEMGVDPAPCVRTFRNHFVSMNGSNKNARKVRWDLAFENWVERDKDKLPLVAHEQPTEAGPLFDGTETSAPPAAMLDALSALQAKQGTTSMPGADVRWTPPKPKEPNQ